MEKKTKQLLIFLIFPLSIAVILVWIANFRLQPDYLMHVSFYDVGQGDSMFIETYSGNQILIDGGPSDAVLRQLGSDMPFFDRSIDLLIMSHPHTDHVTGLIEVIKRYKVKKVLMPEVEFEAAAFQEFLRLVESKKIEKIYAKEGMRIFLDNATVFDVYYPKDGKILASNDPHGEYINPNGASIVGKLTFGKTKILLTGDAGSNIELELLPKYNLDSDILKVGHQGSRFSSSAEFLAEVTPQYSVIEVGKNSYGHPTQEVLDKLKAVNSQIFCTDLDKTVKFTSDGASLQKR